MVRPVPRHDRDAGGPADVLAAKAALRQQVWSQMSAARVARFPGAAGRIPNFAGAETAAERLRATDVWQAAATVKANPDSAQLPVRQRALEDGKTVYMAVPRLAGTEPFFALDPGHLSEPPRKAASIRGASRSARRVTLAELPPVDLVVMGRGPHHHTRARHRLPPSAPAAACRRHLLGRPDRGKDRGDTAAFGPAGQAELSPAPPSGPDITGLAHRLSRAPELTRVIL
jgi:5-formyltetrahydrofolate cyclo-ligase family